MSTILDRVNGLNALIKQGAIVQAMEQYYHPDTVMQDNNRPPCIGKAANLERENTFMKELIAFKKAEVLHLATGHNVSMVEWHLHFTHQKMGEVNHTQVSVQEWKDGLIIKEHFYYYE